LPLVSNISFKIIEAKKAAFPEEGGFFTFYPNLIARLHALQDRGVIPEEH